MLFTCMYLIIPRYKLETDTKKKSKYHVQIINLIIMCRSHLMCQYLVLSVPTPAPDQYCVHTCVAFFRAARVGHLLTIVSSKTF